MHSIFASRIRSSMTAQAMRPTLALALALALTCCLALPGTSHAQVKEGGLLPALTLSGPVTQEDATLLGVPKDQPFAVQRIGTPFLLLQLFSMYCPHCQREAPHLKTMYETMVRRGLHKKITLLGLGVGNSAFEVNTFRTKFAIPFPLVPDKDFVAYNATGKVGTPYYVLCAREGNNWKVLFMQEGSFEDADAFLSLLLQKTGLAATK